MNIPDESLHQLKPTIVYCLDHDLLASAEFTAERLIAQNPDNPDMVFLYALTLFKTQRYKAAYNATADYCTSHVGCSYAFAKSCMQLQQAPDGISSLTKTLPLWTDLRDTGRYEPDNIACYMLLAKLYSAVGETERSAMNYAHALKLNPYIFEAFEELCRLGAKVKVNSIYRAHKPGDEQLFAKKPADESLFKTPTSKAKQPLQPQSADEVKSNYTLSITPRTSRRSTEVLSSRKKTRSAASSITSRLLNHSLSTLGTDRRDSQPSTGIKRLITNTFGGGGDSGAGSTAPTTTTAGSPEQENGDTSVLDDVGVDSILRNMNNDYLVSIYSKMAKGFRAMCAYDCFRAIRIFDSLPANERNTPWVLAKQARLHFEIVNYEEAEKCFLRLRKLDRTRVEDMEYYSTLLWHLHKEIELSFLCHELYEIDRTAPQTFVAVGNLYSLKRDPDEAIKCFQRAVKADRTFVYAYTLQGHEYLANDGLENATECFRHAIALDRRHYNAFYGLGMVHLKLGNYDKAEFHFRQANEINPLNVILICCVGMVLEKLGKTELALDKYVFASKLQPLSMLALFKKAQALFSLKQYDLSLRQFQILEDMAPDEASVHFLLGKLYKIYGRKNEAIKELTIAQNLDPKGGHLIKEALENLQQ